MVHFFVTKFKGIFNIKLKMVSIIGELLFGQIHLEGISFLKLKANSVSNFCKDFLWKMNANIFSNDFFHKIELDFSFW